MSTTPNSIADLEMRLIGLKGDLQDAADAADRLDDTDAGFDIGVDLLDARKAVQAALDVIDRLTAPTIGPRFAATIVHNATLDAAYAAADELFAV